MTFKGITHCLRCGKELRASALSFIGDCCATKVTPAQLEAMRIYAEQLADPFRIPEPRPMSAEGRRNRANLHAALQVGVERYCRHDNVIGRCGACVRERDPNRAAERILADVCGLSAAERRAERVAVQTARRDRGIPAWAPRPAPAPAPAPSPAPAPRPTRPQRATRPAAHRAVPTGQLELL
ncbi:hypothetical protein [Actinomadura opuntiae]|uniref:hypothetical protein n=1 Tax=Actinomadura sp. OS1-43 TaxID=604315 RepID=UPI00255AD793|nr:hypothetical protein [Actinomadura sp. OS1-43]MDL4812749.1 hypothetical protein [Actinomadura sp. OS1-43]